MKKQNDAKAAVIPSREALRSALANRRISASGEKGHEIIARTLKALGVTHVYGVSGTPIHETLAACSHAGIRAIGTRHQQAAVFSAAAHNFLTGKLSAVPIASAGPAVSNLVTGLLFAQENCWPLVVLGGRRPLNSSGRGYFQELDGTRLVSTVTKHAETIRTTAEIEPSLRKAAETAFGGRPGPVYLDVSEEALTGRASETHSPPKTETPNPSPPPEAITQAFELLTSAAKPLVIFGKGVRWNDAYIELRNLIEGLHLPFIASPMGRGFLPDGHDLAVGSASPDAQAQADVVLLVGARLNWQFRFGAQLNPRAKLITIEIEASEFGVNREEHLRLRGDARAVLARLNDCARIRGNGGNRTPERELWLRSFEAARATAETKREDLNPDKISPARLMEEVRDFLPQDAITCLDGHLCMLAAEDVIPCHKPLTRLNVGSNGTLGVGVPFAIAAKLARPDQLVVAICGDSAFGFSAMELETAVRHNIPIIVIVADNQGIWGGHIHKAHYPESHERVAMYGPDLHYEHIGNAFGAHAEHVISAAEVRPALERAARSKKPACIHVRVDPLSPLKR